jgi:hypothetical protein
MREIITQPLLLGMNLVTLIGFAIMLLGMRAGRPTIFRHSFGSRRLISSQRAILSTALMSLGSTLVILGIYLTPR